jgi:hypothetical protein
MTKRVLIAAYPEFAEFQILPFLYLLRDHVDVITAGPDRDVLRTECGLNVVDVAKRAAYLRGKPS